MTARNASWNGNLPGSGSTTFDFLASWNDTKPAPTSSCTLG
ncbi:hypothetical protein [Solwaraspora sp. WMMD792]|nr:hypothetical protein [Solwaraspora sp. WMMD792]MDG4772206.1 hypothetical protein [Solwaraspora sp. WMMD792]